MRKNLFSWMIVIILMASSLTAGAQEKADYRTGEKDTYRRSSLCLMLVTHQGERYARDIEQQFMTMPLPSRYNSLNVDVRVVSTQKKVTNKSVGQILRERGVAKELVAKWFNRQNSGVMNMERIHDWGGYNATFADLQRAQNMERGTAILSDEGTELLKNTFVMVCDISYYDRSKTGDLLSGLLQVGAAVMAGAADQQARKGNNDNAQLWSSLSSTATAGSKAAEDIAGFSVNVIARLYRLKWNDQLCQALYNNYWVDETTPEAEALIRKSAFDRDSQSYGLEFLGSYRSSSGQTVSRSNNNLNSVIRSVCSEAVERSINNLSKMFPVFKPKTPFYCEDNNIYAYIGTKEGVTPKSKYEVLETKKTKKGIEYNKVAQVVPTRLWYNTRVYMSDDSIAQKHKGTQFRQTSGRKDICDQGLMLREMGRIGYQYRRHTLTAEYIFEPLKTKDSKIEDFVKEKGMYNKTGYVEQSREVIFTQKPKSTWTHGISIGWNINFNSYLSWNVVNAKYQMGANSTSLWGANTGVFYRFLSFGKGNKNSIFIWPTVGYAQFSQNCKYKVWEKSTYSKSYNQIYSEYVMLQEEDSSNLKDSGLDWRVKLGIQINAAYYAAVSYSAYASGPSLVIGINL